MQITPELVAEIMALLAKPHPRHPALAHVVVQPERFILAARSAKAVGEPIRALHLASFAEGAAAALAAVVGPATGILESRLRQEAAILRGEIQAELARLHPECGASLSEEIASKGETT